jgi:hypothetical protein
MDKKDKHIVPEQRTGKAIDASGTVELDSEENAKAFFSDVKQRLANVNGWSQLMGGLSATFQVVDKNGNDVERAVQKGDFLRIDVPGPGSKTGDGFDWVTVEDVEHSSSEDSETFGFRVRPTENPNNLKSDIAHFYSEESTSSFLVTREGRVIRATVKDRNTKPNADAETLVDKIRDAVVGAAGVMSFSKIQWQGLVDGLLNKTDNSN